MEEEEEEEEEECFKAGSLDGRSSEPLSLEEFVSDLASSVDEDVSDSALVCFPFSFSFSFLIYFMLFRFNQAWCLFPYSKCQTICPRVIQVSSSSLC